MGKPVAWRQACRVRNPFRASVAWRSWAMAPASIRHSREACLLLLVLRLTLDLPDPALLFEVDLCRSRHDLHRMGAMSFVIEDPECGPPRQCRAVRSRKVHHEIRCLSPMRPLRTRRFAGDVRQGLSPVDERVPVLLSQKRQQVCPPAGGRSLRVVAQKEAVEPLRWWVVVDGRPPSRMEPYLPAAAPASPGRPAGGPNPPGAPGGRNPPGAPGPPGPPGGAGLRSPFRIVFCSSVSSD